MRRVDGCLEPEVGVVRDRERLVVGVDRDQRNDGAERLVAVDQRVDADVVDHGRLVVEAGRPVAVARAADDDLGALLERVLEMGVHLPRGRLVVHRPDERRVVEGVAEEPRLRLLHDRCEEVVVHALVDEHAFGRAADLPGAEEASEDSALGGELQVGVGADDDRPVAARLDQAALEADGPHDLLRRPVRADEADAVDVLVRDQALAHRAVAVDDVHDTFGKPGLRHDLHEVRHRDRGPLGRLHHDRVPGGDPGRDQLDRNQRREVPGRDAAVDAVRLAEGEDPLVDVLGRDDRRLHPLHVLGGDPEVLGRLLDVGNRLGHEGLSLLEGELAREVFLPLLDQVCNRMADLGPVPRRQRRPARLRLPCRTGRAVDVLCTRVRGVGELLARDGGDDLARGITRRLDPVAADEVLKRPYRRGHVSS